MNEVNVNMDARAYEELKVQLMNTEKLATIYKEYYTQFGNKINDLLTFINKNEIFKLVDGEYVSCKNEMQFLLTGVEYEKEN